MVHAFIDESGTDQRSPVVGVAAFYGTPEQWSKFKEIWKLTPGHEKFHALKSSALFPALCEAIEASEVTGLLCTIGKKGYKLHAGEHFRSAVGNCYALCTFLCAMSIHEEVGHQPISVVLEEGQPNLSFVKRVMDGMIEANEHSLAAVTIARKRDFIELHTADFVSHLSSTYEVEWIKRLLKSGRLKHGHLTEEIIASTSPQIKAMFSQARNARRKAKRGK